MAAFFPSCEYIKNPVVTELSDTSIQVQWGGAATTYKLRYRLSGVMGAWTEVTMAGPGSLFPGSTYFTHPNPPQVNPGAYDDTIVADFTVAAMAAGATYDLELINVCIDGSEYTKFLSFSFAPACAAITNFKVVSELDGTVKVSWDPIAGVTDYVLVIDDGSEDDDSIEVSGDNYTLRDLIPGRKYVLYLNYLCSTGGSIKSDPLSVIACACTDKEEDVVAV